MRFALGVCDFWDELTDEYEALNIRFVKQPIGYPAPVDHIRECLEPVLKAGMTPIVDLRTERKFVTYGILGDCPECGQEYRLVPQLAVCPNEKCAALLPLVSKEEAIAMVRDHDQKFAEWCLSVMGGLGKVNQFEIWGEPQCPILTGGGLPPPRLAMWMKTLKENAPHGTLIYNGGLGIGPWKDCEMQQLIAVGTLQFADAFCLHPFSFQGDPLVQGKFFDWMLAAARAMMRRYGLPDLPILVSEWGYPSGVGAWEGSLLVSNVMPTGIEAVSESLQAEIMDACFRVFHNYDVGPICLMSRDLDATDERMARFWAFHCGWFRSDMTVKPETRAMIDKWGHVAARAPKSNKGFFVLSSPSKSKRGVVKGGKVSRGGRRQGRHRPDIRRLSVS